MNSREKIDDVAQDIKKVVTWEGEELQSQEKQDRRYSHPKARNG